MKKEHQKKLIEFEKENNLISHYVVTEKYIISMGKYYFLTYCGENLIKKEIFDYNKKNIDFSNQISLKKQKENYRKFLNTIKKIDE